MPTAASVIKELKKYANRKNVIGMAHFGITGKNVLGGPSLPILRQMAKKIGTNHELAQTLWDSGIHEARILATFLADPDQATKKMVEKWANQFDSWDICDQVCNSLYKKMPYAHALALRWAKQKKEFVKRAGFVMMAVLAIHDKKASDADFIKFFALIKKEAIDERNFVKKAVSWALRQIGKRNERLRKAALCLATDLREHASSSARWIGGDAYRELTRK